MCLLIWEMSLTDVWSWLGVPDLAPSWGVNRITSTAPCDELPKLFSRDAPVVPLCSYNTENLQTVQSICDRGRLDLQSNRF
jgi:hypothetical protein